MKNLQEPLCKLTCVSVLSNMSYKILQNLEFTQAKFVMYDHRSFEAYTYRKPLLKSLNVVLFCLAPPNITKAPQGVVAKAGSSALFPCNFTAHPLPSIKWSKNNVEIKNEGRFHILIEEDYTQLQITDLVKADDGDYRLDLRNAAGSYWASAGLVVTGARRNLIISSV